MFRHIYILILFLLSCFHSYGQRHDSTGNRKDITAYKGGISAANYLQAPPLFNAGAFDSCRMLWVEDGNLYFHDCIGRLQVLSMKDSDLIKAWAVAGTDNQTIALSASDSLTIQRGNTIWLPYLRKVDTNKLSARINLKLNISDTTGKWLSANTVVIRPGDTAAMLAHYARLLDLADSMQIARSLISAVSYTATGYVGLSGNSFYLDTGAHKAATKTDLNSYYLNTNPAGYISSFTETDPLSLHSADTNTVKNATTLTYANGHYYPLTGNPSGYITVVDSVIFATRARVQKAIDSLNNSIGTKQPQLNGTGIVRAAGTSISYDNTVYYPASNPNGYGIGTITSIGLVAGTGTSISGTSPITASGTYTVVNTAPDQTVVLTASTGMAVTGTYPNFTLTNTSPSSGGTVTSVGLVAGAGTSIIGSSPITGSGTYTVVNTAPDQTVTLTAGAGVSIGGAYPTYTVTNTSTSSGGTVTSIATTAPITGGTITNTGTIGITQATTSTAGYLSSTDWNTFNGKGNGTVTSVVAGTGLSGGTITTTGTISMPATGTAGTYGTSTTYPVITTDAQGRVTTVTTQSVPQGTVTGIVSTSGDLTVASSATTPSLTVVSAPKFTTARNINGVAFDGTASITVTADASTLTNTVSVSHGGTGANLSATGGAGQFLKQVTAGAAITVGTLSTSDIPDLSAVYTPISTVNSQTVTTYTLVASDKGKVVSFNNASSITLTVPTSLGSTFYCTVQQMGAGTVTPTASGTTLRVAHGFTKSNGQYTEFSILFTPTTDTYVLQGDMQ